MFGRHPSLKTLDARKRLLVAEAEIHRAQLQQELQNIHTHLHQFGEEAKSMGTVITGAVTVVSAIRGMREVQANSKSGLFSKLLKGARFASTVWQAFRPR